MNKQRLSPGVLIDRLRVCAAFCAACGGAAVLAIGIALVTMTALFLVLGALGVNSAPDSLLSAAQDAAVALYAVQLVGISFFNQTAELRFAAVPGLLLVGLSVLTATAVAVRSVRGSARRKMTVALAMPIPYALLIGFAGLFVPLHFTAPGFAVGIAVSPSPAAAFLLPLGWGLLFASIGGLIGTFGRDWRRAASRQLGAWAAPLGSSLRVLAVSLAAGAAVALVGVFATTGADLSSVTGGGLGHAIKVVGGTMIALPTLAAAVIVSGFGVPFGWEVDALSHGAGSISAFDGTLPSSHADTSQAQGAPGVFALAPLIVLAAVLAIGWLSARCSGSDSRLGLANAARAATLTTLAVWLLALLARVDAQAGGLLGFHLTPDAGTLLWRVPLVAFAGCLVGGLAWVLTRGPSARRQLAMGRRPSGPSRPAWVHQGLTWRAALGLSFAVLPVALLGVGATGTATSAAPGEVSLAPIEAGAEQILERASTDDESVAVTVNPETRVVGTASVNTPLRALGIAPGKSRATKAEDVLGRYGELFGLSDPAAELDLAESSTDKLGVTHVSFTQTANGLPVFGGGIGVHLSRKGELLNFISGSLIPDVSVSEDEARISSERATEVAREALPSGALARPPVLQVYAGVEPYVSGPDARLAWFVWLISKTKHASEEYVVDAVTGEILDTVSRSHDAKVRKVYVWPGEPPLPGELVREEGDPPTSDEDADNAYEFTGDAYDFYAEREWDSVDDKGSDVVSTVDFTQSSGAPFENAYWNGEQMVFGDGYTGALDIVGHEYTHAVIQYTSELIPSGQAGALGESFSDIVGATIEMENTEEVNWEIGEELPNNAVRDLEEPSKHSGLIGAGINTPDPEHLSEWLVTCLDGFGIHVNSTITSHAFYLATTELEAKAEMPAEEALLVAATLFYEGWTQYLTGVPSPTLEAAREAALQATENSYGEESVVYEAVEEGFDEVGLDGVAQPPALEGCTPICSFAQAVYSQQGVRTADAVEMLSTLYKARGELAMTSAAGDRFMPLYEFHMGRINELVSQDPVLAEMTVSGLEEITPGLEALIEGKGEEHELTPAQMEKIEAALRRLAEDDRLFGGPEAGELADLIDEELEWMGLPSYEGMDYEAGWQRLNGEAEGQMLMEETGVIVDPNCTGQPYSNDFHVNGFYVDTPGHRIPGQVSPLNAGGVICGTEIEELPWEKSGCVGEETLNTEVRVQLPPDDKVNPSENLPNGSWVGEMVGHGFACAGDETQRLYGQVGLLSLSSWSEWQCPTMALACYEGKSTFENGEGSVTGKGYAWVSEEEGSLTLTTSPVTVSTENGYFAMMGFGQFEARLCARAGSSEAKSCGGPTATWIHQNGAAAEPGCPGSAGRYYVEAENAASESTIPVSDCLRWDEEAHMQTVGAPNSLNAVSCVPATTSCVATNSKGNAFYSTNVSSSSASTWNSWSGPGTSPSHDVACPSSTLCVLAAGEVAGGGGNVYRASSLGGTFLTSFSPANGAGALSCPTTSFCVSAHESGGYIRYSTNPSGVIWKAVEIGSGAMKDVACLSASSCAVVDAAGNVRVATSEAKVKEAGGWVATNINGAKALSAVACSSTTSCIAVDGSNEVLNLTIAQPAGTATVSEQAIAGAGEFTDVTCTGTTCVAVDAAGAIFASENSGATWEERFQARGKLTSASCASGSLCVGVTSGGDVVKFDPLP